ncbi:hypothetical protein [Natrialbaceae archaeon AArc-T1-2]|uniref:hypothetical protein n=1 Tax=Natrialbaceae archaeon AArc-T1-2 TaxID=3053904 RepID=UPI00255B2B00|nr:hypothetical protein [Natrialbaceae archaeon AArc-T1-2]WIV68725.1 hypothetical protein QQ977_16425 [Natrialbaceae archaeon AArc-T1-2]
MTDLVVDIQDRVLALQNRRVDVRRYLLEAVAESTNSSALVGEDGTEQCPDLLQSERAVPRDRQRKWLLFVLSR